MPNPTPDDSNSQPEQEPLETAARQDLERWVERLRRADRSLYNLMAMEVWSIAQTMDNMVPGFWARFMENRQESLKQFVKQQKNPEPTEGEDGEPQGNGEEAGEPGEGKPGEGIRGRGDDDAWGSGGVGDQGKG